MCAGLYSPSLREYIFSAVTRRVFAWAHRTLDLVFVFPENLKKKFEKLP